MKKWLAMAAWFVSIPLLALPPQASFDSAERAEGENVRLNFTITDYQTQKISLLDDDGVATLRALTYVYIQDASEEMYLENLAWEKVKVRPLPHWDLAKPVILAHLERAKKLYEEKLAGEGENFQKAAEGLGQLRQKFEGLEKATLEDINELGGWLDKNSENHSYKAKVTSEKETTEVSIGIVDNDTSNPLGTALGSRSVQLEPAGAISRSRAVFKVDLEKILKGLSAR